MASVGHLAVGLVAARSAPAASSLPRRGLASSAAFWSALSFLPDADVLGFRFGIQYSDEWGHRGATHSFAFSIILGVLVGILAPRFGRSRARTGVFASLVLVSHAVLDTFTDGGLGCALFWPFNQTRYFAPWRMIPVAPIGAGYLSAYGTYVALAEIVIFAPLLWVGTTKRRPGVLAVTSWLILLWVFVSIELARHHMTGIVN